MKIHIVSRISAGLLLCALCLVPQALRAQETEVRGRVTDTSGRPLAGAVIVSADGRNSIVADRNGEYVLKLAAGPTEITFSHPGYRDGKAVPAGSAPVDVSLAEDAHARDERIDLGYTTTTRNALTGAVSTVSGEVLDRNPVANLSQTLAGRLSGVTSMEWGSELSQASVWSMVRGISTVNGREPVVVIDGVICPNTNYEYITPGEIQSVSVLKDASATALYGIQGSNGVIVITTKRGFSGKARVGVHLDHAFQQMTRRPDLPGSARYAELRNEAARNDGYGDYALYSQQEIDKYRNGSDRNLYPDNDYYDMFLRDWTVMDRAGVNVAGGNDVVKYYSNVNFMYQQMPFKIAEKGKYDPTPNNYWINYRSNVDVRINRYLEGFLRLSGNIKREKTTGYGNSEIYEHLFNLPPTMYGPLTPLVEDPSKPGTFTGGQVVTNEREATPVYGMLNRSGYTKYLVTNIISQAGLTLDMAFLTPGLKLTGIMSYQTNSVNGTVTKQNFERWIRTADKDKLEFTLKGSDSNTPLSYDKGKNFFYNLNFFAKADYNRTFGRHSVDAMAYVYYLQQDKEQWWEHQAGMMPYKRQSLGVTATYGYDDRFYLKADLGYSGSDQFAKDHRFMATPAVSAAWVLSNEAFLKDSEWLSYLKLRASYGLSANDQLGYNQRFLYLDDFRQANSYDGLRGNPNIEAEKMKKQNYGIDIGLFNALTLSVDYYREKCDNMLISPGGIIPEYQGIEYQHLAKTNGGKMKNSGWDITLNYMRPIGSDWTVYATGVFSANKNEVVDILEARNAPDYAYAYRTTGYSIGQQWGYLIDGSNGNGYFNSEQELRDSKLSYSFGQPRVGDFIYRDLNDDGVINEKDMAPIGGSWFPRYSYSFSAGFRYKNFDMNFMFQGIAKASESVGTVGFYENSYEGVYSDIHQNAWTLERYAAGEKISYPALSLGRSTNHVANSYFIMNRSYLRLRNVEIGYTLPLKASKAISAEKIRIVLQGQNLFTWDRMKTDYVDPETGSLDRVQPYRVYNIGVNLIF